MSGKTYCNPWKYMVTCSKKRLRPLTIAKHTNICPKQPKSSFHLKIIKVCQKIKRI